MNKWKNKFPLIIRILIIVLFLSLWEIAARFKFYNAFFTSYPSEIILDLKQFFLSGDLVKHTAITLREALAGLFYGTIIGIFVGLLFGQIQSLGKIFLPIVTAIHGVPQLTLAPVYIYCGLD
ncbi:hypothetical protein [Tissierella praeacuta]|uniref:ABC transporter permease n=1 Tax=Tissierella praeacuta TaxID=43131 RepID=UPI00334272C1